MLGSSVSRALLAASILFLPILTSCGGSDGKATAPTAKVRLVQTGANAVYAAYLERHGQPIAAGLNGPRPLVGLQLAGVNLPSLTTFGVTEYVDVPAGLHVLPALPQNQPSCNNAGSDTVNFVAGSRVSLVADPCWNAEVDRPPSALGPGEAEISLLTIDSQFLPPSGLPATSIEITTPDESDQQLASYAIDVSTPRNFITGIRVPASGFRIRAVGLDGVMFRSTVIRLPDGAFLSGRFEINAKTSAQGLKLYGGALPATMVLLDERSALRVTNFSSRRVVWRAAKDDYGPFVSLNPYEYYDGFALRPTTTSISYRTAESPELVGNVSVTSAAGGRYDVILRDTATGGVSAHVLPGQFAPIQNGTGSCYAIRLLNASRNDTALTTTALIEASIPQNVSPANYPPFTVDFGAIAPGAVAASNSYCGSLAGIYNLSRVTVDGTSVSVQANENLIRKANIAPIDRISPAIDSQVAAFNAVVLGTSAADRGVFLLARTP